MRRAGRIVCLLLAALGLAACDDSLSPDADYSVAKSGAVAPPGKPARAVAREAVGAVPQIVNPAEELLEFAPTGLLRWSAVAGADAYEVWAYRDADLTQAAEFSGALASRQYQFTQLAGGQSYWIKLYFRANGVWQEAPTFSIKTTTDVVKARLINSQEELEAFGPSGTLRWTAVAGADVYELWIYRDTQLVAFAETSGPVRITQYQITSLTPGTSYYVQVYARVNGQYTNGGALPLTVTDKLDRARIVNPQEELDAFATNGMLRWSPVSGATAYELWIFTNPNVSEIHESSGSLSTRSYQTRTLQPGRVYYAQAYALVNGQWQVGAPVKITTTASPTKARLTTPQEQLEGFSTTGTLRWSEVPGATAYELWIYSNAGLGKIVESGANADRSYTVRRLCSGATYYVQVYALVNGTWTTGWATRLDVTQGTSAADCIPPAPTVKLTPSATSLIGGDSVTLTWRAQFATSCTASDGWSGSKGTNGQQSVGPLDQNTLFTLVCTGPSGSTLAQALVTVGPRVPATVSVIPTDVTVIQQGKTFRLSADVFDAQDRLIPSAALSWTSSDPSVAQVDATGRVTIGAVRGVATIAVTAGNARGAARVEFAEPDTHLVQFVYVSPSRASDSQDQANYTSVLHRLAYDPAFAWIGTEDRQRYADELALYSSGQRSAAYHDPSDGSMYPGSDEGAMQERSVRVERLIERVRDFYQYHSDEPLRVAPLKSVRLRESALHYWTPAIHGSNDVDRNPIVNKMIGELIQRGEVPADALYGRTIHVLLMDGGGGWAGAWQWGENTGRSPFGGLAAVGDFSTACLLTPDKPAQELPEDRARWPGHFQSSWVRCTYNMALGSLVHELGHTFGLPHPADFQCAGLSDSLVMQSHWNTDITRPGYFGGPRQGTNVGILKKWDPGECKPSDAAQGYAAGIGTPARPNAKYQTELAVLRDNPHFRRVTANPATIEIRNDYAGGVALNPGGNLAPGQFVTLPASVATTVSVWDCGEPGGCKWDPYVLQPDRRYSVASDPSGPVHNLTIVER